MTLDDLLDTARRRLDDEVEPFLYSAADLTAWANEAVDEAAMRARLLQDTTSAACSIALVIGTGIYTLDGVIFVVKSARLRTAGKPLRIVVRDALEDFYPNWRTDSGVPEAACFDLQTGKIIVTPKPAATDTIDLTVWRTTLSTEQMVVGGDSPVIHRIHHPHLIDYMLHRAYEPKDGESGDDARSILHEGRFEKKFGPRPNAQELNHMATRRSTRVTPHYV